MTSVARRKELVAEIQAALGGKPFDLNALSLGVLLMVKADIVEVRKPRR